MITLKEFALNLRAKLKNGKAGENQIVQEILNAKATNDLTDKNVELILQYIENPSYNPEDGTMILSESDNSAFLKAVENIRKKIKKGGK